MPDVQIPQPAEIALVERSDRSRILSPETHVRMRIQAVIDANQWNASIGTTEVLLRTEQMFRANAVRTLLEWDDATLTAHVSHCKNYYGIYYGCDDKDD